MDVLVVASVVADVPQTGVHFAAELWDVAEDTDGPGHPTAGVEDVVLAVVRAQQLHVLRHPDRADQVDREEEEERAGAGPENDDDYSESLNTEEIGVPVPNDAFISNSNK